MKLSMKLSELETGMVVQYADGDYHLVLKDDHANGGRMEFIGMDSHMSSPDLVFSEDLIYGKGVDISNHLTIVKVFKRKSVIMDDFEKELELIWERKAPEKMIEVSGKEYSESTIKKALQEYVK